MLCPKCKDVELKNPSQDAPLSCAKCGGIWVDDEGIAGLAGSSFDDSIITKEDDEEYDSKTGLCPKGHGIMLRARVEFETPFYLERCPHCGGIWFDYGEWNLIAKTHLFDNLAEIWTVSWQRKQRTEKERDHFLDTNREQLGDELFEQIVALAEKMKNHPEKMRALALLKNEITV